MEKYWIESEERYSVLTSEELEIYMDEKRNFEERNLIYAPNSIWHGSSKRGFASATVRNPIDVITIGLLQDFIEYLFRESEHCDHISEEEALTEFYEYTFKKRIIKQNIEAQCAGG